MYGRDSLESSRTRDRRVEFGSNIAAGALAIVALGNLVIPDVADTLIPLGYLLWTLGVLAMVLLLRLPQLSHKVASLASVVVFALTLVPGIVVHFPLVGYGAEKLQGLLIAVLVLLVPSTFRNSTSMLRRCLWLLAISAITVAVLLVVLGAQGVHGRFSLLGLNPIASGRVATLITVICLALLFARKGPSRTTAVLWIGATLGIASAALTGSRGPLVALAASVVVLVVLLMRRRRVRRGAIVAFAFLAGSLVLVGLQSDLTPVERIFGAGDSGRTTILQEAWAVYLDNPGGVGWGSYGLVTGESIDPFARAYPHNIVLELLVEGGLVAVIGFALLVIVAFRSAANAALGSQTVVPYVVLAVTVYAFANALSSSDIVGNRMLWVALGLCLSVRYLPEIGKAGVPTARLAHGATR
jgi:O-antigen ligase